MPKKAKPLGAVVRARIEQSIKDEAAAVLAAIGMTPSDAFRMLMMRVVSEKALPFEPLIPNNETIEAMHAARRGELTAVRSVKDLFARLNADD
ncbi:MAG TPA: type II toxin-antitoxin system antitoxin, RelB/DinJ family [Alphaproteobacteria bacterium]|nr:type II toxin-antitoxin system antitoxin, RelB/DinJ family [Alphaproteobacteria bacterium]HAJ48752.1 type II toxin-antitoxin system antitoxin, RelB/DinJ family [Alphaproteobacteria bacterium]